MPNTTPETKHLEFSSMIAYQEWLQLNYPFVVIKTVTYPDFVMGDMVSRRIERPKIKVTYQEYPREFPY